MAGQTTAGTATKTAAKRKPAAKRNPAAKRKPVAKKARNEFAAKAQEASRNATTQHGRDHPAGRDATHAVPVGSVPATSGHPGAQHHRFHLQIFAAASVNAPATGALLEALNPIAAGLQTQPQAIG